MLPRVPSQNKEPVYTAIGAPDLPYMLNELSPVSQYYAVKASRKRRIKDEKEGIVYVFLNDAGDTLLFSARGKEAKRLYFDFGAAEKNPNILLKANCLGAEKKHADIASEMQDKDLPKKGNKIRTWDECFAKGMDGDYKWQVLTQDILVKAATENLIPSSEKRAEIRRLLTPQKIGAYKKQCENGSNTYPAEVLEAFGRLNNIKFNTWQMAADKKGIRRVVATRYIAGYQLGEKPFECDLLLSGDTAAPVFQELKFNVSETELKKLRNLPDGEEVLEFKPSAASAQRVSPPQKATNAASAAAGLFDLIPPPPPLPITEKNLHHSAVVDESLSAGNTSRFPVGRRKAMGAAEMDFLNTIANLPAERLKEVFDAENQAGAEASFIKALDAIPERQQRENLKAARKRLLSIVGKSDQDPDGALLKEMLKKYVNIRDAGGVNSELGAATIRVVCLMQAQLSRMYSKKAIADIMKRVWDDETWTSDRIDKDFAGIFQDIQRQGAEEKQAKAERRKSVQVSAAPPKAPPPPPPHRSSVAESGDDAILAAARRTDELDALERKQQEDSNKQSASPFQSVAGAFLAAEDEGSDKDDEPFVEAEDYGVIIEYSIDESGLPRITRFSDERNVDDLLRYIKQERHYDLLDISSQADPDEIKKAYRRLALFWHPDKNGSKHAEAIFKGVGSAYTTLSNPDEKNAYDARLRQQDLDRNSSAVASAAAQSAQAAQKAQSSKPAASRVTFQLSNQPALQSTAEVSSAVVVREEKLAASGTSPTHANKMLARRAAAQKADTATVTETSVVAKARDVLEPLTPQKSLLNQPPKPSSSGKKKNASDAVENDTASQVTSSSKAVSRKPGVPGHVVSKRPSVTSMAQGIAVASGASKLLARKAKNTAAAAQSDDMMSVMSDLTADSNFPEPKYQKGNTKKDNTVPSPVLNVSLSDSGSVHSAESGSTMSLRERLGKPPLALGLKPTSSTPTKLSAIDEDTTSVSAVSLNSSDSVNSVKSVSSTMSLRERLGKKPLVLGPKPPSKLPVIKENIEEKATDQAQEMNVGGNTAVLGAVETGMVDPVELDMGAIDKIMKGIEFSIVNHVF
jgi:DnaJ-domain-containing protein 1